jgi:hypothetical protein
MDEVLAREGARPVLVTIACALEEVSRSADSGALASRPPAHGGVDEGRLRGTQRPRRGGKLVLTMDGSDQSIVCAPLAV